MSRNEYVGASLKGLASVLQKTDSPQFDVPMGKDSLFACCMVIGQSCDLKFVQPPMQSPGLDDICSASGLRFRKVALNGQWWESDHGSLLAYVDGSPVALIYGKSGYHLFDPADSTIKKVDAEKASALAPYGFVFYKPFDEKTLSLSSMFRFGLKNNRKEYFRLVSAGLLAALVSFLFPMANKVFFDNVIPTLSTSLLAQVLVALFVAAVSSSIFTYFRASIMLRLNGIFTHRLQMATWDRILKLPLSFFRKYSSGDLVQRAQIVDKIQRVLGQSVIGALVSGLFASLYFVLMLYYSATLTLIGFIIILATSLISALALLAQIKYEREYLEYSAKINTLLTQVMNGIAKVRVASAEHKIFAKWAQMFKKSQEVNLKARKLQNIVGTTSVLAESMGTVVLFAAVMWTLEYPQSGKTFTVGTFLAFTASYAPFSQGVYTILKALSNIIILVPYWERVRIIFDETPENGVGKAFPGQLSGALQAKNLRFRYQATGEEVLRGVSLKANSGEFVGITGPSGCGKSTLCRLLAGLDTPTEGSISYDRKDISSLNLEVLRKQIGIVMQTSSIFSGTILDNLTCGENYSNNEIDEALKLSGFEADVNKMPMGLHTIMTAGGTTLSGGQRQKLLIARILIKRPPIIILDEGTSQLDHALQENVMRMFERQKITRVVVAHRLSTLRHADRILIMKDGKIVEEGTFEQLKATSAYFSNSLK